MTHIYSLPPEHKTDWKTLDGGRWEVTVFPSIYAIDETPRSYQGTRQECEMFVRFPGFANTKEGRELLSRFAEDPALAAWEEFCCGGE